MTDTLRKLEACVETVFHSLGYRASVATVIEAVVRDHLVTLGRGLGASLLGQTRFVKNRDDLDAFNRLVVDNDPSSEHGRTFWLRFFAAGAADGGPLPESSRRLVQQLRGQAFDLDPSCVEQEHALRTLASWLSGDLDPGIGELAFFGYGTDGASGKPVKTHYDYPDRKLEFAVEYRLLPNIVIELAQAKGTCYLNGVDTVTLGAMAAGIRRAAEELAHYQRQCRHHIHIGKAYPDQHQPLEEQMLIKLLFEQGPAQLQQLLAGPQGDNLKTVLTGLCQSDLFLEQVDKRWLSRKYGPEHLGVGLLTFVQLMDHADVSVEAKSDIYRDNIQILLSVLDADAGKVAECVSAVADACPDAQALERLAHIVGVNTMLGEVIASACVSQELAVRLERQLREETPELSCTPSMCL